ncbi:NAD(P)/FAD-dependent oxidoreductase [Chryseolinea sp. H1M3-3]|uniref:NAD(P)/FAD-dependent oxidoreductase n=1 Tax=Chryseolinea sp. H1M3-3 TaxID=3034144 RepID=UPI0023EB7DE4|nr:NAD(P)/FAD-dependent oxidoreductase [Chryseolinea sp. H1M3-3]
MTNEKTFDVIIIGGSYAGLSAGMALGRALRKVIIIDSGKPCNVQTPHSHNFITQDGKTPKEISSLAKQQVGAYKTVTFYDGLAISSTKTTNGFEVKTQSGDTFTGKKIILATGIKDILPEIKGAAECWGISMIHCPYCHGYEYRNEKTGILANGESAFELAKLISNWTKNLTVFTNGKSTLTKDQSEIISRKNVEINENEIHSFGHNDGQIENIQFKDTSTISVKAIYARPSFIQHSGIPKALGCELTEHGLIKVDMLQKTSVPGVFAGGDNATLMRSVASAVFTGSMAGAAVNRELIDDEFNSMMVEPEKEKALI